jgi:hypothetical protein
VREVAFAKLLLINVVKDVDYLNADIASKNLVNAALRHYLAGRTGNLDWPLLLPPNRCTIDDELFDSINPKQSGH